MKLLYRVTFLTAIAADPIAVFDLHAIVCPSITGAVAQITGSVFDSAGGVVPGAQVTATQTEHRLYADCSRWGGRNIRPS